MTVNTELDVVDANDGVTSLREAAALANATVGDDVIEFHPSLAGKTISLNNLQIIFSDSVTITGLGSGQLTIDAHNDSRIFNFTPTALNVTVSGLTLHRGVTTANNFDPDSDTTFSGGALRFAAWGQLTLNDVVTSDSSTFGSHTRGGGIYVAGSLTMISSAVIGCTTNFHNGDGGGIWVGGTATIDDSIIQGNTAGGVNSDGGGISANGVVTITNSLIADNSSVDDGAGVWSYSDVFVIGSTISGNSTTKTYTFGGGVGSQRNVTVISSTITGNSSFDQGGGLWAYDDVTVINSTISGNWTNLETSEGGGIWADRDLIIEFSTITDNTSNGNGGGIRGGRRSTSITSSIVAGNTSLLGTNDIFRMSPYLFPVLYSLIGDNVGTSLVESQAPNSNGSRIGSSAGGGAIDPKLGPLADNGGGVLTHALLPTSPAIDAGMPIPVDPPLGDVRGVGFDRIRDGNGDLDVRADMGAFEVQTPFVASADFTGDGVVDGADFLAWQRGFGLSGTALPIDGDANGDLTVDGADLAFWCETFESPEEEEDLGGGIALSIAASANVDFTTDGASHEPWHEEFDTAMEALAIGFALKAPAVELRGDSAFLTPIPESLRARDDEWNGSNAKEQTLLSENADEYAAPPHRSAMPESELPKATEAGGDSDAFEAAPNDGPEADQVGFDALATLALSAGAL